MILWIRHEEPVQKESLESLALGVRVVPWEGTRDELYETVTGMRPQRAIVRALKFKLRTIGVRVVVVFHEIARGIVGAGDIRKGAIRGRVQRESPPLSRVCRIHFRLAGQDPFPAKALVGIYIARILAVADHDDRWQRHPIATSNSLPRRIRITVRHYDASRVYVQRAMRPS